ncbi:MAG: serine/threonine-protein kinase [Planctomycetota bacterium]|nr:serine/threonine-protein kinase [Planctomycetota bacterium]
MTGAEHGGAEGPEVTWLHGERCVLKRLPPRAAAADTRHLALIDALRRARSAGLARLVDGGVRLEGQRVRWLATAWVEGTSARDVLAHGGLPPGRVRLLLEGLAHGLAALHGVGVVHRDVAPGNVILPLEGGAVLIDYGQAVLLDRPLPRTPGVVGTPGYVAPEVVVQGAAAVTPAVDIYGLAAVGYALLTGAAPAGGEDVLDTLAGATQPPPELAAMGVDVPPDFEALLQRSLAPEPTQRPDAATLAAGLASCGGA